MTEAIIDNPTYLKDVRHFFVEEDLIHMSRRGHDLSTYQGLKNDANSVLQLTLRQTLRCRHQRPGEHGALSAINRS